MSNENDIESALRQAFLAAIPDAAAKTAFENQPLDPAGLEKWYAFHYMPNRPDVATLGTGGADAFTGVVQIDVNVPKGTGKGEIDADLAALRSAFTPGKRLVYESANVIVYGCGRVPGSSHENHYRFSISVSWECRLSRS